MHVLITGAAGMVGRKVTDRLVSDGQLGGQAITRLTLHDIVTPDSPQVDGIAITAIGGDISDPAMIAQMIADKPDLVFHLAAIVSGEAEADLSKGYRVNLDGTRMLFDALRDAAYGPRIVFASSIAVYGAPFPDPIPDDFYLTPLTSYGTQKAIGELLLSDYSRKGLVDGIAIRLPTICVRPGKPNKAASGFFSNIIREPLVGQEAILPVDDSVKHWHASPRSAVGFFVHAATMDLDQVGPRRAMTMPGVPATVAQQIAALRDIAGEKAVSLIKREPDATIRAIVAGWPQSFEANRARELGFQPDESFHAIVQTHIDDELGGVAPVTQ